MPRKLEGWARRKAEACRRAAGKTKKTPVGACISKSMHKGKPQDQAVAIALEKERRGELPRHAGWARRKVKAERQQTAKTKTDADVVATIQREAKTAGATLKNDGKGGLDPNLALKVFRRDHFACGVPGCKTPKESADIDHIGGHAHELEQDPKAAAWLKKQAEKGKENTLEGLHVLCARHHDMVHQRDRAIEDGKKPPPMTN